MNGDRELLLALTSIFKRRGEAVHSTDLYENLSKELKEKIDTLANVHENELPILASLGSNEAWLVLTTQRILWRYEAYDGKISLPSLYDVNVDLRKAHAKRKKPSDIDELVLVNFEGHKFVVPIDKKSMQGLFYVLMNVAERNRSAKNAPSATNAGGMPT